MQEIRVTSDESEYHHATIRFWHVDEDDEIEEGDDLVDIETDDESTITLHSPYSGVVKQIFLEEGDIIAQGDLLAIIEEREVD